MKRKKTALKKEKETKSVFWGVIFGHVGWFVVLSWKNGLLSFLGLVRRSLDPLHRDEIDGLSFRDVVCLSCCLLSCLLLSMSDQHRSKRWVWIFVCIFSSFRSLILTLTLNLTLTLALALSLNLLSCRRPRGSTPS